MFLAALFYSALIQVSVREIHKEIIFKFQKRDFLFFTAFIGIFLISVLYSFFVLTLLFSLENSNESLILGFILLITLCYFIYTYIFDLIKFEIPAPLSFNFLFLVSVFHIFFGIVQYVRYRLIGDLFFSYFQFGGISYLLGGLFLGGIILAILYFGKEKKINLGDVYLFTTIGLLLGLNKSIIFGLVLLLTASVIALFYMLTSKTYRNFYVPLVPFIFFSFVITIGYGDALFDMLFI